MIRNIVFVVAVIAAFGFSQSAMAHPTSGASCIACHSPQTGHFNLLGNTTTLTLGTKRLDGLKPGILKTYVVKKGATAAIKIKVLNGLSAYDVDVNIPSVKGLKGSRTHKLKFTADPTWRAVGNPVYYLVSPSAVGWKNKAVTYTFNLAVSSSTIPDVYEAIINIGGKGNGRWAQQERVYIQVTP